MSRSIATANRPQLALQSYLDGLLQDASIELEQTLEESTLDDFEAAVLEEQVRDAQLTPRAEAPALALVQPAAVEVVSEALEEIAAPAIVEPIPMPPVVEPVAEVHRPAPQIFLTQPDGRPAWAEEPFECLLFLSLIHI
mgnify:FL=1